jgi:flagellar biosynthetic protein FlhB
MPELFETQERTEEATPKRREDARARGQFARSADLTTSVLLLVTVGVLLVFGPTLIREMGGGIVAGLRRLSAPAGDVGTSSELLRATLLAACRLTGPFLACAAGGALLLHLVQAGGFFVAKDALALKFDKLDPTRNLARVFSLRSFVKVGAALLKLAIIVAVLFFALRGRLAEIGALAGAPLETAAPATGALLLSLFLRVTGALLVLGFADFLYQRWQHGRDLRMSKQQVRDEAKQEDGDPSVRRRMRDRIRRLLEKPLRQAVGEATVVITNPTHFAVALEYAEGRSAAPSVAAKGADHVAEEIKRIARDRGVPVIEQPPLARALFRDAKVGDLIPEPLYRAVASVLATVWRLREEKKKRATGSKPAPRAAEKGR